MSEPKQLSRDEYYKKAKEYKDHYDWDHASPDAKRQIAEGFAERYQMVPDKLSPEDYDKKRKEYEEKYDYEHMSDEKKARFDREFDREFKKTSGTDSGDPQDPVDQGKNGPEREGRERGDDPHRGRSLDDDDDGRY